MSIVAIVRRMFGFLCAVKWAVLLATLTLIGRSAAEVLTVYLLKEPFDIVEDLYTGKIPAPKSLWAWISAAEGPGADLRWALTKLLAANVLLAIMTWLRVMSSRLQNMSLVFHMRAAVYDRLQQVGFNFHDKHNSGQLINRAIADLNAVRMFLTHGFEMAADIAFTFIGYLYMMFATEWRLAVVALVPVPLWLLAVRWFSKRMKPIYHRQMEAADEVVRQYTENVAGAHVVRAFATEEQEQERFDQSAGTFLQRAFEVVGLQQLMNPTLRGIMMATQIGIFTLGAWMVLDGGYGIGVGVLVAFGQAMGRVLGRLQHINPIIDSYQRASVSCRRLFEILDAEDATPERVHAAPLRSGPGAVKFRHVTFGYHENAPVLHNVNLELSPGTTTALMGPTGSGKTTLALLLGRFYDPQAGEIRIDGQDLRDVSLRSVREAVGYVFQEPFLFSDTIERNIAYGDPYAPREKVRRAARIAQATEFIDQLPDGYQTLIGEYGSNLSGGQMQRLTIARAVLNNPRVLVLDDALSAVDPGTEATIRAGLERIAADRTVLLVTNRIVSARRADHIVVLENGRITQRGHHDALMAEAGYYREVAKAQFVEAGAGAGDERSHVARVTKLSRESGRLAPQQEEEIDE